MKNLMQLRDLMAANGMVRREAASMEILPLFDGGPDLEGPKICRIGCERGCAVGCSGSFPS
jgi:hypothetical protein